jgi:hypothetical protein
MEVLKHFQWNHLPPELAEVSRPCADLAQQMVDRLPVCAETMIGLRKLLEAKDCFVRAAREKS